MGPRLILGKNTEIEERPLNVEEAQTCRDESFFFVKTGKGVITVTPVMKEILELSRTWHTPEELSQLVSENQGCSYDSIYPAVNLFLQRMVEVGVLVREDEPDDEEAALLLGEIEKTMKFAGFTLLEQIAQKSKVVLYKCRGTGPDAELFYVIKIFLEGKPGESRREFEIINSLPPHKNIRKCITASVSNKIPYLLLEYIDGKSMSHIVKEAPLDMKYHIAYQLISVIDHLHCHGILHGDLHASNFLIDSKGDVHLIDLGMAHRENEKRVSHGGIPRYMPPERMPDHNYIFSKRKGNYISEVFQLGICLYFLFSGNYPFNALLLKDLTHKIKHENPPPLKETCLGEAIPQSVADVVFKSMEKNPADRYQSVSAMLEAWRIAADSPMSFAV